MEFTIKNEYLTVTFSDYGAELQSIKSQDGTEYLWQGDQSIWGNRAPNIFPYVARLTEGKYTVYGKEYEMRIHGFLKYVTLKAEKQSADSITFRLDSNEETKAQYPFDFTCRITYALQKNVLLTATAVENHGSNRMYFGIGGHPGFNVPLEAGIAFEDYYLEFAEAAKPTRVGFDEKCFLTGVDKPYDLWAGKRIMLKHDLFDQDAIVLKHAPRTVKLGSDRGKRSVTVTYPDFPYIGFWHMPHREAPYVCIEPWSSLPSRAGVVENFSQQSDLIGLDAGKVYENTWKIEIQ